MVKCEWTPEGIRVKCSAGCEREFLITEVTEAQFNAWKNGALIQVAMPELSKEVRELLISGTCNECWDKLFNLDEDEDEGEDLTHYNDERDDQRDEWDGGPDNIKDERI